MDVVVAKSSFSSKFDGDENFRKWVHEDELISQRIHWLCIIQGLFFASFALGFQATAKDSDLLSVLVKFYIAIPVAGLAISIVVFLGLAAAISEMLRIKSQATWQWTKGRWATVIVGWFCALCIPAIFAAVWAWVLGLEKYFLQ